MLPGLPTKPRFLVGPPHPLDAVFGDFMVNTVSGRLEQLTGNGWEVVAEVLIGMPPYSMKNLAKMPNLILGGGPPGTPSSGYSAGGSGGVSGIPSQVGGSGGGGVPQPPGSPGPTPVPPTSPSPPGVRSPTFARGSHGAQQTGPAPGASNVGPGGIYWKIADSSTSRTFMLSFAFGTPIGGNPRDSLAEGYFNIYEFAASPGGVPRYLGGAGLITNQPSAAGSTTGLIPSITGVPVADLTVAAFMINPNYEPSDPAGFTWRPYQVRGAFVQRIAAQFGYRFGNPTSGLLFGPGGAAPPGGETQWKTYQAAFAGVNGLVQFTENRIGDVIPGLIASATVQLSADPTPGNLIVAFFNVAGMNGGVNTVDNFDLSNPSVPAGMP